MIYISSIYIKLKPFHDWIKFLKFDKFEFSRILTGISFQIFVAVYLNECLPYFTVLTKGISQLLYCLVLYLQFLLEIKSDRCNGFNSWYILKISITIHLKRPSSRLHIMAFSNNTVLYNLKLYHQRYSSMLFSESFQVFEHFSKNRNAMQIRGQYLKFELTKDRTMANFASWSKIVWSLRRALSWPPALQHRSLIWKSKLSSESILTPNSLTHFSTTE